MLIFSVKIADIIDFRKNSSNLVNFGPYMQRISDILKIQLQKCETVLQGLAEFLNSEQCKSVSYRSRQELSNEYLLFTKFTCKYWRRYSRERASQSLLQISQKLV